MLLDIDDHLPGKLPGRGHRKGAVIDQVGLDQDNGLVFKHLIRPDFVKDLRYTEFIGLKGNINISHSMSLCWFGSMPGVYEYLLSSVKACSAQLNP